MVTWFFHCVVTAMLACLIWIIQILHYPFFKFIDTSKSRSAFEFHQRAISYIVMPLMLAELISAIYLLYTYYFVFKMLLIINFLVILCIWIQTFVVMVPLHMSLSNQFDKNVVSKLVRQNWFRTVLWTIKAIFWISLIAHGISPLLFTPS